MLDLNKAVYNHAPGLCRYVDGIVDGSEALELLPDGDVVITSVCSLSYRPSLAHY